MWIPEDKMSWWFWLLSAAFAQESVRLEVVHTVYAPKKPALVLHPQVPANSLEVQFKCGSVERTHSGPAAAGKPIRIDIPVGPGQHNCVGTLNGIFTDGTSGEMPLQFLVAVQQAIQLRVAPEDLDLKRRSVLIHTDRPIAQIEMSIYGESGTILGSTAKGRAKASPIEMTWSQTPEAVLKLHIKATTSKGLSATLDLFPWSYQIPHQDIAFPPGSAMIPLAEVSKLEDVMANVQAVMKRFSSDAVGFEVPMALYLAGFTDTVGNRVSNQQLSEERAKSLGAWFMGSGFRGDIHYQGFGERALAVQTPDETSEAANRRVMYIIAADTPKVSDALPGKSWRQLR
jgi:hypothetical protein